MSDLIIQFLAFLFICVPAILLVIFLIIAMSWWLAGDIIVYYIKLKSQRDKW